MGSFDCYCAICAATLGDGNIEVGSASPNFLTRRRARVERRRRAREAGGDLADADGDDDDFLEEGEDGGHWNTADDDHAYDPELIGDTKWLNDVRCLGFNPAGTNGGNFWSLDVDGDEPIVFPFHVCCFDLLSAAITGLQTDGELDKNVLYNTMMEVSEQFGSTLSVDHGDSNGGQQFWECVPGEEKQYTVAEPAFTPAVEAAIKKEAAAGHVSQGRRRGVLVDGQRTISDPFRVLSNELVWQIARYLPGSDVLALSTASWPVLNATRGNDFWAAFIHDDMPWAAAELKRILGAAESEDHDYKALCLWFRRMTTPKFGVDAPWTGLANRRRIWDTCRELADLYVRNKRTKLQGRQD
ncbi:beta-Ala-His dipeptidase [Purpureocillium lavendulum]|uniref:Beta-Ala-His dipeptidase n=1 Tax=Purpureocillium lavendulum TaxID=1247861 RepID=A0AB34FKI6_9HYPO|nr:beta-Ala-His dipeptidase [Purpureocillium lavendulum]